MSLSDKKILLTLKVTIWYLNKNQLYTKLHNMMKLNNYTKIIFVIHVLRLKSNL